MDVLPCMNEVGIDDQLAADATERRCSAKLAEFT